MLEHFITFIDYKKLIEDQAKLTRDSLVKESKNPKYSSNDVKNKKLGAKKIGK